MKQYSEVKSMQVNPNRLVSELLLVTAVMMTLLSGLIWVDNYMYTEYLDTRLSVLKATIRAYHHPPSGWR